jgi:dethiobiotin synthetase
MNTLLIAGTDTDVGKTVLTTALVAYWQAYLTSKSLGLMKLIQTGTGDRELYHQLFSPSSGLEIAVPLCFATPVAPPIAAAREGTVVELKQVWQVFSSLQQNRDFLLVEALGGLGSPVTEELTVADLARDWRLPTVLVVPVKLGAISQAVANVALARQAQVNLKGIVLSCVQPGSQAKIADWSPMSLIESLTQVPVLGILPHLAEPTNLAKLTQVVSNLDLEAIASDLYFVT